MSRKQDAVVLRHRRRRWAALAGWTVPVVLWTGGIIVGLLLMYGNMMDQAHRLSAYYGAPACPAAATTETPVDTSACVLTTTVTVDHAKTDFSTDSDGNTTATTEVTVLGPPLRDGWDTVEFDGDHGGDIADGTVVPATVWRGQVMHFRVLGSDHISDSEPGRRLRVHRVVLVLILAAAAFLSWVFPGFETPRRRLAVVGSADPLLVAGVTAAGIGLAVAGSGSVAGWGPLGEAVAVGVAGMARLPGFLERRTR